MDQKFEGFPYKAGELSAYIFSIDIFVISLKNKEVIRYTAKDPEAFKEWLTRYRIRDVRHELPKHIYEVFFKK